MYLKRFIQLFVVFLISLAVFALILEMNFGNVGRPEYKYFVKK